MFTGAVANPPTVPMPLVRRPPRPERKAPTTMHLESTIEHVWWYMDGKLANKRPTTIPALKMRLTKLWDDMDQDAVVRQAAHMQKRLKSLISSGGEWAGGLAAVSYGVVVGTDKVYAHPIEIHHNHDAR